jgi:hypothetical protein
MGVQQHGVLAQLEQDAGEIVRALRVFAAWYCGIRSGRSR